MVIVKKKTLGRDFWTILRGFVKYVYLVSEDPPVWSRTRIE